MSLIIRSNFTITNVLINCFLLFITLINLCIKVSTFFILFISIFFIFFLFLLQISRYITFIESFNKVSNLINSISFSCDSLCNFFNALYTEPSLFLIVFFASIKLLYLFFIISCLSIIYALISSQVACLISGSLLLLLLLLLLLFLVSSLIYELNYQSISLKPF